MGEGDGMTERDQGSADEWRGSAPPGTASPPATRSDGS